MPDRPVIFLGPSLPLAEARAILPDADYRPPVTRQALEPWLENPPPVIGIIDGAFFQMLSLSPKEILPFLDRGVPVLGSSSMGALRAVELRFEGMIGLGQVYNMFVSGELDADDEVAMTFCPETLRPISEPLVNLRVALRAAFAAGILDARECARLVFLMRKLYFPERGFPALAAAARRILPADRSAAFLAWWRAFAPDAKAEDARLLLNKIAEMKWRTQ